MWPQCSISARADCSATRWPTTCAPSSVVDALAMAVAARGGAVAGVPSATRDRGSQYTSNDYLEFCQRHQIRPSVGRTGVCSECWDNAVAESFWGVSVERECLQGRGLHDTRSRPAERSSDGSTGTTPPGCTPASTASHPSSGNSSTSKRHNHRPADGEMAQITLHPQLRVLRPQLSQLGALICRDRFDAGPQTPLPSDPVPHACPRSRRSPGPPRRSLDPRRAPSPPCHAGTRANTSTVEPSTSSCWTWTSSFLIYEVSVQRGDAQS